MANLSPPPITPDARRRGGMAKATKRKAVVDRALEMMRSGEWCGAESVLLLARETGATEETATTYVREALTVYRKLTEWSSPEERADAVASYVAGLESFRKRAEDAGSYAPAAKALELIGKVRGFLEPDTTVNVTVQVAALDDASLSAQLVEAVRARPDRAALVGALLASLSAEERSIAMREVQRTVTVEAK